MVGITKLSELMHLTPRRVQQLAHEGMPKAARGLYDEVACLSWYVTYLQDKMAAGATNQNGELSGKERADLATAMMRELDLAERQKQVITVAEAEQFTTELVRPACRELLAIEARLRPKIGAEAAARCGDEIRRSLRAIAEPEEATA